MRKREKGAKKVKSRCLSQDVTDPFVDVRLGNARIAKTSVIDNDLNPVWNEKFRIEVCDQTPPSITWSDTSQTPKTNSDR